MDKLESIKKKYGYVSSQTSHPDPRYTSTSKCEATSKSKISTYKQQPDQYDTFRKAQQGATQQKQKNKIEYSARPMQSLPKNKNGDEQLQKKQVLGEVVVSKNEKVDLNQSYVKSYEKTYDLLKNYRNRIVTSEKQRAQSKGKLIIDQPTNSKISMNSHSSSQMKEISQDKQNIKLLKKQIKAYPKRCSPLEGIDLSGSVNIYGQIQSINKLQNRINELIRQKSYR